MAKFKVFHQVTIDEYIAAQEDLFPEVSSVPAVRRSAGPARRVRSSAPVFPGAIDGVGAVPAEPSPASVVYSKVRRSVR